MQLTDECLELFKINWEGFENDYYKTTYEKHLLLQEVVGRDVSIVILRIIGFRPKMVKI